ncbi:MAG: hypothetical protein NTX75_16560 [Proteobacteria bacterium]|nr:hypothetical protein [Pseudomonadota bacterium]
MKKKANRRAFFVCVVICLLYASVAAKIPDKLSVKRISEGQNSGSKSMSMASQGNAHKTIEEVEEVVSVKTHVAAHHISQKAEQRPIPEEDQIEPSLFISVPLVCFALKEGLIEKDGLISASRGSNSNTTWKKPLDILKDKDEEGLKNLSKAMGTKHMLNFLKKEDITLNKELSGEDIVLGKGYFVEKKKLLATYNNHVTEDYSRLFPFVVSGTGIVKHNGNYTFVRMKTDTRSHYAKDEQEWLMPNLINLPSKLALEKLITHTSKIKIMGSGNIAEQYPRPFERIRGEAECVIYGKTYK